MVIPLSDDSVSYQPIMPFVAVASRGGPYDDESYCAGWEANAFAALIVDLNKANLPGVEIGLKLPVRSANVAQLDLIAMNAGWLVRVCRTWGPADEWSYIHLTQASGDDGGPSPPHEG